MNTFGTLLYKLRKEHKLTQSQLAEKLDLTDKAISRWENDESKPEVDKLLLLSKIFNVTVDELLNGELKTSNNVKKKKMPVYEPKPMSKKDAIMIFLGVSIIIIASFIWVIFYLFDGDQALATALFFILTGLAVSIFINTGMTNTIENAKELIDDKKKLNKSKWMIIIGVYSFILSVIGPVLFHENSRQIAIGVVILLGFVIIGLGFVIIGGVTWSNEFPTIDTQNDGTYLGKPLTVASKIHSIIWICTPLLFFVTGIIFHLWHVNWVIFPIAGALSAIIGVIFSNGDDEDDN